MNEINKFRGEYFFLSNFYPCTIEYNGRNYYTVEHAFQSAKSLDPDEQKLFMFISDPGEAKKWGRQIKLREDWEQIKIVVMKNLLFKKFSQPELKEKLLNTGDSILIEGNSHRDTFWGVYKGNGQNMLGKLLMQVRDELKRGVCINDNIS